MAFAVVRLTTPDDEPDPHYPLPGESRDSVRLEPQDGPVRSVRVSSIRVADVSGGRARTLTDLPELRASLHVTHSRVAVASSASATFEGWVRERPNPGARHTLAGHLRYTWVTSVHARTGTGWTTPNTLSLGFRDPVGTGFGSLTLTLARTVRAEALARAIAALAARAQARADGVPAAERAVLESFAADPRADGSGGFVRFTLPRG